MVYKLFRGPPNLAEGGFEAPAWRKREIIHGPKLWRQKCAGDRIEVGEEVPKQHLWR
jgi:hypothetical protein